MRLFVLAYIVYAAMKTKESRDHLGRLPGIITKHDYKQSFKAPFSIDPSKLSIPYWTHSAEVQLSDNVIRLVPSLNHKFGSVYSTTRNNHKDWMVEFSFLVQGTGIAGGEGLAFWYVKDFKPFPEFYGGTSQFEGLGIIFDTSDHTTNRHNPFIYAIENTGSKQDWSNYASPSVHLASCSREYRNSATPVFVKVIYLQNTLSLEMDTRQGGRSYTNCFKAAIRDLPVGYQFAISAATQETSYGLDDHDILSFETFELNPAPKSPDRRPEDRARHEFKMDKAMEDKIKFFEHELEEEEELQIENGGGSDNIAALTAVTVARLEESQFHILESLDLIQTHLVEKAGSTQSLETLQNSLNEIRRDLSIVHEGVDELRHTMGPFLQALHLKVSDNAILLESSNNNSNSLSSAIKIFAALAGVALLLMALSTLIRSRQGEPKKFV